MREPHLAKGDAIGLCAVAFAKVRSLEFLLLDNLSAADVAEKFARCVMRLHRQLLMNKWFSHKTEAALFESDTLTAVMNGI